MALTRSEHMARIAGKHTSPERLLRSGLWGAGLRYRLHVRTPVGRPDIVFPGAKVVIFVDGCFWHGCPEHYSRPRSREEFWAGKLTANVARDRRQTLELEAAGWRVVRVWEHDILANLPKFVELVAKVVRGEAAPAEREWRVYRVTPATDAGTRWERRQLCLLRDGAVTRSEVGPRRTGGNKKR